MKAWIPLTLALLLGNAAYAQDACVHPSNPAKAPDGATATKDDMIAGSKVVKEYKESMDTYLSCVQGQIDAIPAVDPSSLKGEEKKTAELQKKQKDQLTKKYDAAVDEEKANVELFNVQLRIYKSKKQ